MDTRVTRIQSISLLLVKWTSLFLILLAVTVTTFSGEVPLIARANSSRASVTSNPKCMPLTSHSQSCTTQTSCSALDQTHCIVNTIKRTSTTQTTCPTTSLTSKKCSGLITSFACKTINKVKCINGSCIGPYQISGTMWCVASPQFSCPPVLGSTPTHQGAVCTYPLANGQNCSSGYINIGANSCASNANLSSGPAPGCPVVSGTPSTLQNGQCTTLNGDILSPTCPQGYIYITSGCDANPIAFLIDSSSPCTFPNNTISCTSSTPDCPHTDRVPSGPTPASLAVTESTMACDASLLADLFMGKASGPTLTFPLSQAELVYVLPMLGIGSQTWPSGSTSPNLPTVMYLSLRR